MAYDVYPYSYRNFQPLKSTAEEKFELPEQELKRGDLEGYLAAKDFASKTYSSSVCANAQANIRQLNYLRPDITSREYINILIKQGQVPEKHFKYQKYDTREIITELNSNKDIVKQVIFDSDTGNSVPVTSRYFNPDTGIVVKEVQYHKNGKVDTKTFYDDMEKSDDVLNYSQVPIKTENPFEKLNF